MKIYLRYPIPKSLSSRKGLTIASLKVLVVISFIIFNQLDLLSFRAPAGRREIFRKIVEARICCAD